MRAFGRTLFVVAALVTLVREPLQAQEMAMPVGVQFSVFTRVFAFDRQFGRRAREEIVIGIVYQRRVPESSNIKEAVAEELRSGVSVRGRPIRVLPIPVARSEDLEAALSLHDIDVLYITPLRSLDLDGITTLSRRHRVLTCTGVPDYVTQGLAVGIGARRSRPLILINLAAARAEGAEFSSELLKLAQIIEGS